MGNKKSTTILLTLIVVLLVVVLVNQINSQNFDATTTTTTTGITGVTTTTDKDSLVNNNQNKDQNVIVEVECVENWIFSKYDIRVYADGDYIDTLTHGATDTYTLELSNGVHTFRFENDENDDVYGEVQLLINNDKSIELKISCYSDEVTVSIIDGTEYEDGGSSNSTTNSNNNEPTFEGENNVEMKVVCDENLLFSRYDVKIYVDGYYLDTLKHGTQDVYRFNVLSGSHTIRFENADDNNVYGEYSVVVEGDKSIDLLLYCFSESVSVNLTITINVNSDYFEGMNYLEAVNYFENLGFTNIELGKVTTESDYYTDEDVFLVEIAGWSFEAGETFHSDDKVYIKYHSVVEPEPTPANYHSSNNYDIAKKGDSGVFAYKKSGGSYDLYYIIDFDEGYIYWFSDEDTWCDRVKIVSGNLNTSLRITYHDGGDEWSYFLHFNYENSPSKLIMCDQNGFTYEYLPTSLSNALNIRNGKHITDY